MDVLLGKINKLSDWQVAIVIAIVGFAVFSIGLNSKFVYDDIHQSVDNDVVHSLSITHISQIFGGGTFYKKSGNGSTGELVGAYYRPLMLLSFAIMYSIFGNHPLYFHLIQLILMIGCATLIYLILKYSVKPVLALSLALIFLVHPLDSQAVYYVAALQDVLLIFFGLLAIWILLRFESVKSLLWVALCLTAALFAKEVGIMFVVLAGLYLFWFDKRRFWPYLKFTALPVLVYIIARFSAIGSISNQHAAQIGNLTLGERILTIPSLLFFYFAKLVYPFKLATGYYFTVNHFSLNHVLLPLIIDILIFTAITMIGIYIWRQQNKSTTYTYLFFATMFILGLIPILQIVPLDMTACDAWFLVPIIGIIGMVGVFINTYQRVINSKWLLLAAVLLIISLCIISAIRGATWNNPESLYRHDIAASPDNFVAYGNLAVALFNKRDFQGSIYSQQKAIQIFPTPTGYRNLAAAEGSMRNYHQAKIAFENMLKFRNYQEAYDGLAELTLVDGTPNDNYNFLIKATTKFPNDYQLWMYLAIIEQRYYGNTLARYNINIAEKVGYVPPPIYDSIFLNKTFMLSAPDLGVNVKIQPYSN